MTDAEEWGNLVANPEALGKMEKELWLELKPILSDLLDELKANGKIETVYVQSEMDDLEVVIGSYKYSAINYNLFLHTTEKYQEFLAAVKPFRFNEELSVQLFVEVAVLLTVFTTEMFRTLLLFHSKGLDPEATLGRLLKQLGATNVAPNATARLRPYLDIEFRNALAHGLFGTKEKKIVLYKNAKFDILEVLDLADFMIRSKKQGVLTQCMINEIAERKRTGFFFK